MGKFDNRRADGFDPPMTFETDCRQHYINGEWVDPVDPKFLDVINPATEEVAGRVALGSAADVDKAVAAAKAAFPAYARTSREDRLALLGRIVEAYQARLPDFAAAITTEMGAPAWLAEKAQAPTAIGHLSQTIAVLKDYAFEETRGRVHLSKEPIGVCGLITPWNWPINQIACKVAPALAAGCTVVLKPSEIAPLSAYLFAQVLHDAQVPAGVFNLVNGDGPTVGAAISSHPDVDMVSFTGSTRAGVLVAKAAADTVKRVAQELGGKSPNIILDDADIAKSVKRGAAACFNNTGQSCNAPTRMLVPAAAMDEAIAVAKATAEATRPGDPAAEGVRIGPVVSQAQFDKVQGLIQRGIDEGAELVAGGPGRPDGLDKGYYVKPTVFARVSNDMTIAREEIFGPVLVMIPYDSEDQAIDIANDTLYGLSAYVQSGDIERARKVASRLRAGSVHINGAGVDYAAPFGGYKQSGNGREWGELGFEEFLEVKSVLGYDG